MKRAAMYLRVSTNEQTTENQRLELARIAEGRQWSVVSIYSDTGLSGGKSRHFRPGLDQALKDALRSKYDVLMSWDVSRLGRSLPDLLSTLGELQACSVDLYLHHQALDTTTPSGKAMFQMCGVFAEFERSMVSERVKAGLQRAKSSGKSLGRPTIQVNRKKLVEDRALGTSIRGLAKINHCSVGKIHKLLSESF